MQERYEEAADATEPVLKFDGWGLRDRWKHAFAQAVLGESLVNLQQYERAE